MMYDCVGSGDLDICMHVGHVSRSICRFCIAAVGLISILYGDGTLWLRYFCHYVSFLSYLVFTSSTFLATAYH